MDCVVEHLGDFLSVGSSMLAQFLPEAPSVHNNASLPVSSVAAAVLKTGQEGPSCDERRRSSLTDALQWFTRPMSASHSELSRNINVISPQSS